MGSFVAALGFSSCGMSGLSLHSPTRDQTSVLLIARQILNHWTTGEAPALFFIIPKEHTTNFSWILHGPIFINAITANPIWNEAENVCVCVCVCVWKLVSQCLTLCDSMDCSPWNSPGQNTGVGSLSLLQGIFSTQGSNPGLLHCRRILYQLSHKGSPRKYIHLY